MLGLGRYFEDVAKIKEIPAVSRVQTLLNETAKQKFCYNSSHGLSLVGISVHFLISTFGQGRWGKKG